MANVHVTVKNEETKKVMLVGEILYGTGKIPAFEGTMMVANPTPEQYASLHPDFAEIVNEEGFHADELSRGIIYYDAGCERPLWVLEEHVELQY